MTWECRSLVSHLLMCYKIPVTPKSDSKYNVPVVHCAHRPYDCVVQERLKIQVLDTLCSDAFSILIFAIYF